MLSATSILALQGDPPCPNISAGLAGSAAPATVAQRAGVPQVPAQQAVRHLPPSLRPQGALRLLFCTQPWSGCPFSWQYVPHARLQGDLSMLVMLEAMGTACWHLLGFLGLGLGVESTGPGV